MKKPNYSRRKFINKCFTTGGLFLGSAYILSSCNANRTGEKQTDKKTDEAKDCNDLSEVSEVELKKRASLGYVVKSPNPNNFCGNCSLYLPPKEGKACGGCLLFKGPVYKEGHCVQWAAIA